jgi:hypothetical protein
MSSGICPQTRHGTFSRCVSEPTLERQQCAQWELVTVVSIALLCAACASQHSSASQITPEYDPATGKLTLLKYDSNNNGKVDTWSYMDGARVVRIEIDKDEDGKIDRWEYYAADRKLEKVGFSRLNDGKEDAWSYADADGTVVRIDVSTRRDGRVSRVEHYRAGALVDAEEDSDGDGAIDKWETYQGDRLTTVAFDTSHRGNPTRRLVYGADGAVRVEVDRDGAGKFVAETTR